MTTYAAVRGRKLAMDEERMHRGTGKDSRAPPRRLIPRAPLTYPPRSLCQGRGRPLLRPRGPRSGHWGPHCTFAVASSRGMRKELANRAKSKSRFLGPKEQAPALGMTKRQGRLAEEPWKILELSVLLLPMAEATASCRRGRRAPNNWGRHERRWGRSGRLFGRRRWHSASLRRPRKGLPVAAFLGGGRKADRAAPGAGLRLL